MKKWLTSTVLWLPVLAMAGHEPTVGEMAREGGAGAKLGITVRTPSILKLQASEQSAPDPRAAIAEYDALLELAAPPEVQAEALRRSADLRVSLADRGELPEAEVAPALRIAVARYQRLLASHPDYALRDRALYQLARAQQLAGEPEASIVSLSRLMQDYPQSPRFADAALRAGELFYARRQYARAEAAYRRVLERQPPAPLLDLAQSKLAWSLYQQSQYNEALPVFAATLERKLPEQTPTENRKDQPWSQPLRGLLLSLEALGGGKALNQFLAQHPQPRLDLLAYTALAALMLEHRRYGDAAEVYAAYIDGHAGAQLAPEFQKRAIAAYEQGGFGALALHARQQYVERFGGDETSAGYLGEIARDAHARAQVAQGEARGRAFAQAARWYERRLQLFPKDAAAGDTRMLYADALYESGKPAQAVQQYRIAAYESPAGFSRAGEAAYAALQMQREILKTAPASERRTQLRQVVSEAERFAQTFPQHAQSAPALSLAAGGLLELEEPQRAADVASALLDRGGLTAGNRREMLAVLADARYRQAQFGSAELAYARLLKETLDAEQRSEAVQRLAASIYKQGEAARAAGDSVTALAAFQRVGRAAPEAATIRATADYDAATLLIAQQNWPAAVAELQAFIARYPAHAQLAEIDKKLAVAAEKAGRLSLAANTYTRIATRSSESAEVRREAAWQAALLQGQSGNTQQAEQAYGNYVASYPQPLERALLARRKLADIAQHDAQRSDRYLHWLEQVVSMDAGAGSRRSNETRALAAQASLDIGRWYAQRARSTPLTLPVERSLPRRKQQMETAMRALGRAGDFGFADVSTAATHELATIYRDLGEALLASQKPRNLDAAALAQYRLLLEEQAFPFEQKAIELYESNLRRVGQGHWNESVRSSALALADLAPARYGKRDQRESSYDTVH